jgi:uncharacterized membrane protein (DUF4010 family)
MIRILQTFLTAALLGAFIGLQREKDGQRKGYEGFAGLRTSIFIALLGALATYLNIFNEFILPITFGLFGLMVIVVYIYTAYVLKKTGGTAELSLLLLFLVGVLTASNQATLAIIITIFMGFIHSLRKSLHSLTERFSEDEILDTLKFATITFVVLPLLPNIALDPFGIFNPYKTWLTVVFISGIGFIGYISAKFMGQKRGIAIAGILGGIASSTATTTAMASGNKKSPNIVNPFAFAICIANAVMFIRVLVEVVVINPALFTGLIFPLGIMVLTASGLAMYFWFSQSEEHGKKAHKSHGVAEIGLKSPFTIGPALKFGVFFVFILTIVRFGEMYLGEQGVYLTSFISGFADVDAIALSLSNLSGNGVIEKATAIKGITIAVMVNTGIKLVYIKLLASNALTKVMAIAFAIMLGSGLFTLFVV